MYSGGDIIICARRLSLKLLGAQRAPEKTKVSTHDLDHEAVTAVAGVKQLGWNDDGRHLSERVRRTTLDC